MLKAVKYYGRVGIGVTSPLLFRAHDKKMYVVKIQNNPLGLKVLVNELLAANFGRIMNLCFPPGDIIQLDDATIHKSLSLQKLEVLPGNHFASQFINRAKYVKYKDIALGINKTEMAGVILFDHMFYNMDRVWNRKNLIIRYEKSGYKIFAIDNSHLFLRCKWTVALLETLVDKIRINYQRCYGRLLEKYLSAADFLPYINAVKRITNKQIEELIYHIPYEWLSDDAEREMLACYIRTRCNMVEKIWVNLCEYIPKSHRKSVVYNIAFPAVEGNSKGL